MTPGDVILFGVGGVSNAAYLFIVASGLSLVFGALRVINMAHGSFYMIAAFVTVVIANQIGAQLGFWGGLLVAVAVTGAIGGIVEVLGLRRGHGGGHLLQAPGWRASEVRSSRQARRSARASIPTCWSWPLPSA